MLSAGLATNDLSGKPPQTDIPSCIPSSGITGMAENCVVELATNDLSGKPPLRETPPDGHTIMHPI